MKMQRLFVDFNMRRPDDTYPARIQADEMPRVGDTVVAEDSEGTECRARVLSVGARDVAIVVPIDGTWRSTSPPGAAPAPSR